MFFRKPPRSHTTEGSPEIEAIQPEGPSEKAGAPRARLLGALDRNHVLPGLRDLDPENGAHNRSLILGNTNDHEMICIRNPSTPFIMGATKMRVYFTSPLNSECFEVDVEPSRTAAECINALMANDHLQNGQYQLVVNGKAVSPNQSLGQAGVTEGSTVAIHKMETGAALIAGDHLPKAAAHPPML